MVGWHHWLNGYEFEETLGNSEGQRNLACWSSWGGRESDTVSDWTTTTNHVTNIPWGSKYMDLHFLRRIFLTWTSFNFILFFNFTILYWFCRISKWIRHRFTCVPHPEPSSLSIPSLWVVPVHQPQASSIVHRTWTGDSFHIWYYMYFMGICRYYGAEGQGWREECREVFWKIGCSNWAWKGE